MSPGPSSRPWKGWVGGRLSEVSSAGFLGNYDGSPAPVFLLSLPLFPAPWLFPPLSPTPHSSEGQKDKQNLPQTKAFGIVASAPSETAPKPLNAVSAMWGKAPPPGTWRSLLPFVKGLVFFFFLNQGWGEGCEVYFLPSFQLVDYGFFCICGLVGGIDVWFWLCVISCWVQSLVFTEWFMGENFSRFRLISNRRWIYLTLVSIGLLVLAPKDRKQYFCYGL